MFTDGFGTVRIDAEASGAESDLAASRIEASGCDSAVGALSTGTGFGVPVPRARGGHKGERSFGLDFGNLLSPGVPVLEFEYRY